MDSTVFFGGWPALVRILVVGPAAYAALVVLLRLGGKRTLSKMNAFDFVVTISFGSALASTLLSKDVALSEGVLALAVLVALQFAVTWTEVRFSRVQTLVRSEPALVAWRGQLIPEAMRGERLTDKDVLAAARKSGVRSLEEVHAAVLELDGSISVIENGHDAARGSRFTTLGRMGPRPGDGDE